MILSGLTGDTLPAAWDVVATNRAGYGAQRFEIDAFRSM